LRDHAGQHGQRERTTDRTDFSSEFGSISCSNVAGRGARSPARRRSTGAISGACCRWLKISNWATTAAGAPRSSRSPASRSTRTVCSGVASRSMFAASASPSSVPSPRWLDERRVISASLVRSGTRSSRGSCWTPPRCPGRWSARTPSQAGISSRPPGVAPDVPSAVPSADIPGRVSGA